MNLKVLAAILSILVYQEDLHSMQKTYHYITSANGYSALVFDELNKRVNMFYPHIYKNKNSRVVVNNILYDTYFGLSYEGKGFWLSERDEQYESIGYLENSSIIYLRRNLIDVVTEEYIFSPMTLNGSGMIMLIKIKANRDISDLSVFSIHNFHLGLEGDSVSFKNERIEYDSSDIFIEGSSSTEYIVAYKPLIDQTIHAANPVNIYIRVREGGRLKNVDDTGMVDDAVCGFERDFGKLKSGEEVSFGVFILYDEKGDKEAIIKKAKSFTSGKEIEDYLRDEIMFWRDYFARLSSKTLDVVKDDKILATSVVLLKMAQVREENSESERPYGQIVASLPPGMWNITWLRDMVYSILAFIEIGAKDEALSAIKFVLNADTGYFKEYVGRDYKFSVCRYYGDGREESDSNEDGPNIEFDGPGLFLIGVFRYIEKYGLDDLKDYIDVLFSGFADVLLYLIDSEGLIKADSSIWERHLNGREKHFTYTQITALKGLCAASYIARKVDRFEDAKRYEEGYQLLRENIFKKLVHKEKYLVSSLEEYRAYAGYLDASVIEAINFDILSPDDIIAKNTIEVMKNLKTSGGGYKRNDDGDWYDRQEWVFIDLRMAHALKRAGFVSDSNRLIKRVTDIVGLNNYQFPELITEDGSSVTGSIPMIGFGAAAYILSIFNPDLNGCNFETSDAGVVEENSIDVIDDVSEDDDIYSAQEFDYKMNEPAIEWTEEGHNASMNCSCNFVE